MNAAVPVPARVLWPGSFGTWIASPAVGYGLAGAAAVLVVLAVLGHRRARRTNQRARSPWLLWPAAVLTLVLAGGVSVNAWVGYFPDTTALRTWLAGQGFGGFDPSATGTGTGPHGTVTTVTVPVPSELGVQSHAMYVYSPPGYDPVHHRYPVIYLFHGSPGTPADWFAAGQGATTLDTLIDDGTIGPVLAVAPDLDGISNTDTECLDSTTGGPQVETYLLTVVVPYVDSHYATIADRSGRAVVGMSSGGFCAVDQGLRHQDVFSAIGAIEPYTEPGAGGRVMLETQAQFDGHDASEYVPTMAFPDQMHVFVDGAGGAQTSLSGRESAQLVEMLRAAGQDVQYRTEPGQGHTWITARLGLPYALAAIVPELAAVTSTASG